MATSRRPGRWGTGWTSCGLSIGIGNYDRVRPLADGEVQMDGVDPVFMFLEPEEIFFRAFRGVEFDICELSLSSFSVKTAPATIPYVGVPVFPSRAFRHTAIYVRTDRIKSPADCAASASARRNGSSPPMSGRAPSWRTTTA